MTSPMNPNLNISSAPAISSATPNTNDSLPDDFLTAPLEGLCLTPMHLMTEEEKRQKVIEIQQMRQSFQTFKAKVEKESRSPKLEVEKKPSMDDMAEFF